MKGKTRKAISKRFKITRTGKVMRRIVGQMHYRAKKSGKKKRDMRRLTEASKEDSKKIKKLLKN